MDNLVSVIIPCYNGADTVDRAIQSVFLQDNCRIELIIVNDGSTDKSEEKILAWQKSFEEKDHIFKYVYQKNKGLGGAINTGLKYVTGVFLTLLDADDQYLQGSLAIRTAYLQEHPECDAVRTNGWHIHGEQKYLFVYENSEKNCADVFRSLIRGETNNWAGSYMVRTEPLFAFYPEREIYASRYGQNLQILLPVVYNKPCGFIDKPLMNYIHQINSLSRTSDSRIEKDKALENAAGYRDVRIYMLNAIVTEPDLLENYIQMLDGAYWRFILNIAARFHDKKLVKDAYEKILLFEKTTYQDKLTYYRQISPLIYQLIRVINKLKRLFDTCEKS